MRRTKLNPLFALPLVLGLAACPSEESTDAGVDAGFPDTGAPDTGIVDVPDSGVPDTGPLPCLRDQGGVDNRGCDPGEVCNLAMDPPQCVPGHACTNDDECNACSALQNAIECGHGFHLTAFYDTNHGNVCTRARAPCEPCEEDRECGKQDAIVGGAQNACVDYGDGDKFCGRPCSLGCPQGFQCQGESCVRTAGCPEDVVVCPESPNPGVDCVGTDQICPGVECPDTGGAKCSTNDLPGALGTCIGFCSSNDDCPAALPICNLTNGICISGCSKDSCPAGQVCHVDGFCAPPCAANEDCTGNDRYGEGTYCNIAVQPPPRYYKDYRDANSCAPLGCERPVDCAAAELVCDRTLAVPECVDGCFDTSDCRPGNVCKRGDQSQTYTREQCRALENIPDGNTAEIGACCYPGCLDRVLQCGIGEFCCGAPGSPYEDPSTCLTLTSTGTQRAAPGLCFEHGAPAPWCLQCEDNSACNSGWAGGFNVDTDQTGAPINGGQPFQEQELCITVGIGMGQVNMCSVTCNPKVEDTGCPGRWPCTPLYYQCFQDADCGGLECIGEDTTTNPPRPGRCKCGQNGNQELPCPGTLSSGQEITYPRCVPFADDMVCVGTYYCAPPSDPSGYATACGF
jgi:hypothetical protein